jgi:hypothetical protein
LVVKGNFARSASERQVLRPHAGALELAPQRRDVAPGAGQGGFQALELEGGELGRPALDGFEYFAHFQKFTP